MATHSERDRRRADRADRPTDSVGILGGATSGSGRIFDQLREQRGLAYDVGASSELGLGGGLMACSVVTDPNRLQVARRALWEVLMETADNGVGDDELARVKSSLVDGAVLSLQRSLTRADHLAATEAYGPGAEHYREVLAAPGTVERPELNQYLRELIRPDRHAEIQVLPG